MDQEKEPGKEVAKIPVVDRLKQVEQDLQILREGYRQCIEDLEASNKMLVMYNGMDPVQLTGEVLGHRQVLDSIRTSPPEK